MTSRRLKKVIKILSSSAYICSFLELVVYDVSLRKLVEVPYPNPRILV